MEPEPPRWVGPVGCLFVGACGLVVLATLSVVVPAWGRSDLGRADVRTAVAALVGTLIGVPLVLWLARGRSDRP